MKTIKKTKQFDNIVQGEINVHNHKVCISESY